MKSVFSLPSAVVALLLAGDASAYHLGGSDPRAIRNNRRQEEESASPELATLSDSAPTPRLTFTPSPVTCLPSGAPPFPTGIFNHTSGFPPRPYPTATGSPGFPGFPGKSNGPVPSSAVHPPTASVDCSALASSIFRSIFPYPTGGPTGWPGPYPTGGPMPSVAVDPPPADASASFTTSDVPFPMPTFAGPADAEDPISTPEVPSSSSTQSGAESTSTFATLTVANKRHAGRRHGGYTGGPVGPIPSGVFPPGQEPNFPAGVFPHLTEEQIAQISHFFEVCGTGNGGNHWWFPVPGKRKGCDEDGSGNE